MSGGAEMNPQVTKRDPSNRSLEERLALVEAMLADLQRQVETNAASRQITGRFKMTRCDWLGESTQNISRHPPNASITLSSVI